LLLLLSLLLFGKDDLEWNKDPMILPGASNPSKAFIEHVWKHTEEFCAKKCAKVAWKQYNSENCCCI
jgi:hypothetical protein